MLSNDCGRGREGRERRGRARLGFVQGPRVPSYATDVNVNVCACVGATLD